MKNKTAREFLPAVIEIEETPPSVLSRAIIWVIAVFFTMAIAWAVLGEIDIVSTAQGKIIPTGKSKTIQTAETALIKAIHVVEGQTVKAGDILVELDLTLNAADKDSLTQQRKTLAAEIARFTAIAEARPYRYPTDVPMSIAGLQAELLKRQYEEYDSTINQLLSNEKQKKADAQNINAQITKLSKILPILTERSEAMQKLAKQKMVSQTEYLNLEQQRIETEQDLKGLRYQLISLQENLKENQENIAKTAANFKKQALLDLSARNDKLAQIERELDKADELVQRKTITAPIDGIVQALTINTIGGVVVPAEPMMTIVPTDQTLEVEATILNKDIGFIRPDMPTVIKVDAFPYTKYGHITGNLKTLNYESVQDEKLGLVFHALVGMDSNQIQAGEQLVSLTPGMTTTVEITTGKRRIIEYFLTPLLTYQDEAINER